MNVNDKTGLTDEQNSITDLIDIDELRGLCKRFYESTGCGFALLEFPGLKVLFSAGCCEICAKFHRSCPESAALCRETFRKLIAQLDEPGKPELMKCENGLVECAFPIMVKGKRIAGLFSGQKMIGEPDRERFRRQAALFGFNEQEYMRALDNVPVISEEKLRSSTSFFGEMAILLSELSYARLTAREEAERLKKEITLRKETEESLRESGARLRSVIEISQEWIWSLDISTGRHSYSYPASGYILGYSLDEYMGYNWDYLLHRDDIPKAREILSHSIEHKTGWSNVVLRWRHKDGSWRYLESNAMPVLDGSGKLEGFLGSDRDITMCVRVKEALRTNQDRLSQAMELANIVYWEFDPVSQTYLFDDPFYVFYGTTAAEEGGYRMMMEEYAKRFIHPDDLPLFYQHVAETVSRMDSDFVTDFEHRIIRRDGAVRHILARTRIIHDGPDEPLRVYGANQDITDCKMAQQEREKLIVELRKALSEVKTLSGLLPICSSCKKIRNDQGRWEALEAYIRDRSDAEFSHGICPECAHKLYPELYAKE